ncbi:MAG: OmpA family protein, partial [Pseudomonadota bacterium]|nr:OmpA family protein [Pseudomonadota bacterium]
AESIKKLPSKIAIIGHTDATPYRSGSGYSNWDLSTDRAHASRRALIAAGLPKERLATVTGKAATDPLNKADSEAPSNRRISILLLREATLAKPSGRGMPAPKAIPIRIIRRLFRRARRLLS